MKHYINGNVEKSGEHTRARRLLLAAGIYQTLGGFAPYYPHKASRTMKKKAVFTIEDIEFTIIEREVMSFSFDSMRVSAPYIETEALFQTALTHTQKP